MFERRTTVALAALALSGCWPRIPGKADDYLIPDTALVTGGLFMVDPVGGYWSAGAPFGGATFGVLAAPQAIDGVSAYGAPDTCVRNYEVPSPEGGFRSGGGAGTAALVHNGVELRLAGNTSSLQWSAEMVETDWETDTDYDLAAIEVPGLGSLDIPGLFTTPRGGFIVTGPEMGGEEMAVVSGPEALVVTWDSDGQAEWVTISAFAVGPDENVVEFVSCLVDDTGSFTIPPELFTGADSTAYVALQVGAVEIQGGTTQIGDAEQGYVTNSAWLIQGAVSYGGAP